MRRRLPDSSTKKVCLIKRLVGGCVGWGVGSDRARRGDLKEGMLAESAGHTVCKWHWGGSQALTLPRGALEML